MAHIPKVRSTNSPPPHPCSADRLPAFACPAENVQAHKYAKLSWAIAHTCQFDLFGNAAATNAMCVCAVYTSFRFNVITSKSGRANTRTK